MNANMLPLLAGLLLVPMMASAEIGNAQALAGRAMHILQGVGFAGTHELQVPSAPAAVPAVQMAARVDETAEALATLAAAAQKFDGRVFGVTLRELGLSVDGEFVPVKGLSDPLGLQHFDIVSISGEAVILIEEMDVIGGKKKRLRSYLISADGVLQAAAVTRKENGKLVAEAVPLAEAQAGCRALLDFWVRYYRDNLKNPSA